MKTVFRTLWVILITIGVFSSCTKDEDPIFSENPTERINNEKSELSSHLLGEEQGYKGIYFSKNDEYGGATFYFKFNSDGTVQSTSDFDDETDIVTSSYRVSSGTTAAELVFEDRGHIQKMSNPSKEGLVGVGFKGSSVFQYFGTEDGVLKFRDIRNKDTGFLTLTPTGFSNFNQESVESVNKSFAERKLFLTSPSVTAFPFLKVETPTATTSYDLNYDSFRFYASPSRIGDDGLITEEEMGFLFTEDGLIISPALENDGVSFEYFQKDTTGGALKYISSVDGSTATIGYGTTPATPLDVYDFGVRRNNARYNYLEPSKSSLPFRNLFEKLSNQFTIDANGRQISRIYFRSLSDDSTPYLHVYYSSGENLYTVRYYLNIEVNEGIVKLSLTGDTTVASFLADAMQPIVDLFVGDAQGYYLKKTGGLLNYSNRTFSMINVADPTMWINYYDF